MHLLILIKTHLDIKVSEQVDFFWPKDYVSKVEQCSFYYLFSSGIHVI